VIDAVFPYARDFLSYPDLLAEGLEPHKVSEIYFTGSEDVNCRVDITATFDLKLAALACHASQVGERMGQIAEWLRARCRQAGESAGCDLAESFHRADVEMVGPFRKKSQA